MFLGINKEFNVSVLVKMMTELSVEHVMQFEKNSVVWLGQQPFELMRYFAMDQSKDIS